MTKFKPQTRCPKCSRCPPVRFSGEEVQRAKRERQSAHVCNVQCPRCGHRYWIQARDIAAATPEEGEKKTSKRPSKKRGLDSDARADIA